MRIVCFTMLAFVVSTIHSQSYVDSGIQKYQVGQFEEAIDLFNKGYELRDALPNASVARIFFYRGLSRFELLKSNGENAELGITLEEVYSDINNSIKYEDVWPAKLEETNAELYEVAIDYASNSEKLAKREKMIPQKEALLMDRITYFKMASTLRSTSNASSLIGDSYKQIGDLYFESTEDLNKLQIAKTNYDEALKYYEIARYDDPYSKEIIEVLLEISKRLLDQNRIEEYEKLLKLAGG